MLDQVIKAIKVLIVRRTKIENGFANVAKLIQQN